MVSTQIFDRYEPGLEDVNISLEGPRAFMERPWVKKLSRWFADKIKVAPSMTLPISIFLDVIGVESFSKLFLLFVTKSRI